MNAPSRRPGDQVGRRVKRTTVMVTLAVVLAGAPQLAAAARTEVPAGTGARIDPALAAVAVTGPALRRAEGTLERASGRLEAAVDELARLGRVLEDLAAERARTEADLAAARTAIATAEAALDAARQHLAGTVDVERASRSRLAEARAVLRTVAVDRYIRSEDPGSSLLEGHPRRRLDQGRRQVLGAAVSDDKVARVAQRVDELAAAVRDRRAAERRVAAAVDRLEGAREHHRRVAASLAGVLGRITSTRAEQARQTDRVYAATADRDGARAGVLDARVLSEVVGADFPLVALDAYWKAARAAPCPATWWALAGIGRTESGHGTSGGSTLDARGRTTRPIIGIPLAGGDGTARVGDSDGGRLDGDAGVDRAVGPMQFIPSTWARWGTDGNGDGTVDPHNLYDAAAAAARYLCSASGDLRSDGGLRRAYLAYNHSGLYVDLVLRSARSYQAAVEVPEPG